MQRNYDDENEEMSMMNFIPINPDGQWQENPFI